MILIKNKHPEKPNWQPPESLPDLSQAKVIALDIETKDPNLLEKGPGTLRRDGHILGISYCTDTGIKGYLPYGHVSGNIDHDTVRKWANDQFGNPLQTKVGANILYDLEWLRSDGINVLGHMADIQVVEALLDEERDSYSLDSISQSYLGEGKDKRWLTIGLENMGYKSKKDEDARGLLWKLPPEYVGEYAEIDAERTLQVYQKQLPLLKEQSLESVYQMEMDLIPLILEMRFEGVRVDLDKADQLRTEWRHKEQELEHELHRMTGMAVNVWAAASIGKACDKLGIIYPRTDKTKSPSFTGQWLESQNHPFLNLLTTIRGLNRLRTKFIETDVLQNAINGRIHCQFHPMRRDEGGTRSGRFSSSKPNLQQVPNLEHSPDAWKIRSLFLPREGEQWAKLDYSQQEPRILVHYAATLGFKGAKEAVEVYRNDSKADFYQIIVDLAGVSRSQAKLIYLARTYGLGKENLAKKLGKTLEEAQEIAKKMDEKCPFIKEINNYCQGRAKGRGYIRTLAGRLCHFTRYELLDYADRSKSYQAGEFPVPFTQASERWVGQEIQRAGLHKALNRLIQGSAADMTKRAMLNMWKEHKIVPLLQVHDEIDVSVGNGSDHLLAQREMQCAYELEVPMYVDNKTGNNWGECK